MQDKAFIEQNAMSSLINFFVDFQLTCNAILGHAGSILQQHRPSIVDRRDWRPLNSKKDGPKTALSLGRAMCADRH
tara:strand:+ start:1601 stop:1828 length:228 start_codon:yes stop_codon:yes gene_type:complete